MISIFDMFRTRKSQIRQFVASAIRLLAEIDEKYKSVDESKRRQIDKIFIEIQKTIFRDYTPRSNDDLSQELVIKPGFVLGLFLSPTSIAHREIKKLIILLRECERKSLGKNTTEAEQNELSQLVSDLVPYTDRIYSIINS